MNVRHLAKAKTRLLNKAIASTRAKVNVSITAESLRGLRIFAGCAAVGTRWAMRRVCGNAKHCHFDVWP